MHWLEALNRSIEHNESSVLITIVSVEGSSPRGVGTRMLVTDHELAGTIGGGALEHEATQHARRLLLDDAREEIISEREFTLGSHLTQCCGGRVTLQFDCHWASEFTLHVFGAGHVAQEVCRIAQRLHALTTFHDARKSWLEKIENTAAESSTPGRALNARIKTASLPEDVYTYIESLEPDAYFLIMTHSHELDMELVEAVLSRNDSAYCGLIASKSKAISFKNRLERKGFTKAEINALTAPMGALLKTGNTPMEVAIASMSDVINAHTISTQRS